MAVNNPSPPEPPAWDRDALRDPHGQIDKARRVEAMFDAIAPTYERVNTIVTFGRDVGWRQKTVAAAGVRPNDIVLDVCCGTGDMIRAFAAAEPFPGMIIGIDFAANMLASICHETLPKHAHLIRADALQLPLADQSVDAISCAFGVRNFQNLRAGLQEMARVLRTGGRVVILEFALPQNYLLRLGYRFYCRSVLPRLAAWISRDRSGAYRYLPQSIQTFEPREALAKLLRETGFENVTSSGMNFGGVVLYRAEKP